MSDRSDATRPCAVKFDGEGNWVRGKFHRWADIKALDDENRAYTHTVAVVELYQGAVREVEPGRLQFLDV